MERLLEEGEGCAQRGSRVGTCAEEWQEGLAYLSGPERARLA